MPRTSGKPRTMGPRINWASSPSEGPSIRWEKNGPGCAQGRRPARATPPSSSSEMSGNTPAAMKNVEG